jgi:hypothetical protein
MPGLAGEATDPAWRDRDRSSPQEAATSPRRSGRPPPSLRSLSVRRRAVAGRRAVPGERHSTGRACHAQPQPPGRPRGRAVAPPTGQFRWRTQGLATHPFPALPSAPTAAPVRPKPRSQAAGADGSEDRSRSQRPWLCGPARNPDRSEHVPATGSDDPIVPRRHPSRLHRLDRRVHDGDRHSKARGKPRHTHPQPMCGTRHESA